MTSDLGLFIAVAVVWTVLALAYALVPMLAMPGAAPLWGVGAALFALIALAVRRTEAGRPGPARGSGTSPGRNHRPMIQAKEGSRP